MALPTTVWTAPSPGSGGAHSAVGRIMAAFPDRASNAIVLTAAHLDRHPHRPVAAVPSSTPPPGVAAGAAARATEPAAFWADMFTPTPGDPPVPSVAASVAVRRAYPTTGNAGHGGDRDADGHPRSVGAAPEREAPNPALSGAQRWDLVVVELGCRPADDRLGLLGAGLLAPGGVLAVLTHSEQIQGRLLDPTGSIVSSAQAADLLYLQHIVLLTERLNPTPPGPTGDSGRHTDPATDVPGGEDTGRGDGVTDLLLFLQPGDPDEGDSTDSAHPGAGSTLGTTPPAADAVASGRPAPGGAA